MMDYDHYVSPMVITWTQFSHYWDHKLSEGQNDILVIIFDYEDIDKNTIREKENRVARRSIKYGQYLFE